MNHEDVGEEDDYREEMEGVVERQGPVAEGVLLIGWVHAGPVENILE